MGEVAVSSEDLGGKRLRREAEKVEEGCGVLKQGQKSSAWVIMWEKLLKRRMLRVLLVEADDSTRQVIAALLRRCSYKVVAVSDGLKAWEVLKGRPNKIDLILTEVDLPAISGFALLTLIMEHEICKNIPIIMMSSHDSISRVYKCMLRGAADYLVKPIRKNELSNLWQHVWRKQTSMSGFNGGHDESLAQQKVEATCENNTASNHSSGDMASVQRSKELIKEGSDEMSSCTKPDLEAETTPIEDLEEHGPSKYAKAYLSVEKVQENEPCLDLGNSKNGDTAATRVRDFDLVYDKARDSNFSEGCDNNNALVSSASRKATNFTFNAYPTYNQTSNIAPSPELDLSLRRSESHSFENEIIEERNNILLHSDSSAFKRYNSRQLQNSSMAEKQQLGCRTESDKNTCNMVNAYTTCKESMATTQLQQRVFPIAVPAKGSVLPPLFYAQSSVPLPTLCLSSVDHKEPCFPASMFQHSNIEDHNSPKPCKSQGENARNGNELSMHRQDQGMESSGNQGGQVSPTTDQSTYSGLCNGAFSCLNSVAYGSNCRSDSNADQIPAAMTGSESKTEDLRKYGVSNRSVQREAALTKFRLKRKERCYEKKVRYESRKKLAEKRPRVKGQFVRQLQA